MAHQRNRYDNLTDMNKQQLQLLHSLLSVYEDFLAAHTRPPNYESAEILKIREVMKLIEKQKI